MDRILCVVQWIGSYVSCTGTHVLEQTVQGARHIRCIVLRNSTDGRWLLQGKSGKSGVARFVQYGDCIGKLLPSSDRAYTSACRTSTESRGRRRAAHALFDAAYPHISSSRTYAVSPTLSRSDLVQEGLCQVWRQRWGCRRGDGMHAASRSMGWMVWGVCRGWTHG